MKKNKMVASLAFMAVFASISSFSFAQESENYEENVENQVLTQESISSKEVLEEKPEEPVSIVIEEKSDFTEKNPWSFSITTDFAYYPLSARKAWAEGKTHFAPLTGIYSSIEGRVTGKAAYVLPLPLGDSWLVKGGNIKFTGSFEVTPVSIKPGFSAAWTPLPFIVFEAGSSIGTGWELLGLKGMAAFDGSSAYTNLTPFSNFYLNAYAQGTFQFDTGAIWAGDWTHVQLMYTYQVFYENLLGLPEGEIWMWQCTGNKCDGLQEYQNLILAYQMPLVLSRAGFIFESSRHYKNDYSSKYDGYNGTFTERKIAAMGQFTLGKHDLLTVLAQFNTRRAFTEEHEGSYVEPLLKYSSTEWFFNRVAFSWTHSF